jgi:hypothetical protein
VVADGGGGGRKRGSQTRRGGREGRRAGGLCRRDRADENGRRPALGGLGARRASDPHDRPLARPAERADPVAHETVFRGSQSRRLVGDRAS